MQIEEMELLAAGQLQVRAQASPRLAIRNGKVVVVRVDDGKAGDDRISVLPPAQYQIRAIRDEPSQPPSQPGCLIRQLRLARAAVCVADLLQGGDVRLHVLEQRGDPRQIAAPVAPDASVDVPGHEAHGASSLASRGSSRTCRPLRSRKKRCRSCGRTTEANAPWPNSSGWIMNVSSCSGARPPCDPNSNGNATVPPHG